MKTRINKRTPYLIALLFIGIAAVMASCTKDKMNDNDNGTAHVKVVNAVDGSSAQDLYLDNTKLTTSAVAYGSFTGYLNANSGSHAAQFKDSGTADVNTSFNVTLDDDNYYSVYYTSDNTTKSAMVIQDDKTDPQSGKARVRFIQLSPAISTLVDIGTTVSGSAKLATKLTYKTATSYYNVDPNTTFSVYTSGSSNVLLSIPASLLAGDIYTIYISGSTTLSLTFHLVPEKS